MSLKFVTFLLGAFCVISGEGLAFQSTSPQFQPASVTFPSQAVGVATATRTVNLVNANPSASYVGKIVGPDWQLFCRRQFKLLGRVEHLLLFRTLVQTDSTRSANSVICGI